MSKTRVNAKSATFKLSDPQRAILSAAIQREDRCLTGPVSLRGSQIVKLGEILIGAGYAREVRAKGSAPTWRQDGETGAVFALKLTAAGAKAIAAAGVPAPSEEAAAAGGSPRLAKKAPPPKAAVAKRAAATSPSQPAPVQGEPRPTSKIAAVIGLLLRAEGATLADLIAATDWLPHTTRAALTGLRKRGYVVTLDRADRQHGSVYRVTSPVESTALKSSERAAEVA